MYSFASRAVVPVGVALAVVVVHANGDTVTVRNIFTIFAFLVYFRGAGGFTTPAAATPAIRFTAAAAGGFATAFTAAAAAAAAVMWVHSRRSE